MDPFRLKWTNADGPHVSAERRYDRPRADRRTEQLEAAGATGVEIVPVSPRDATTNWTMSRTRRSASSRS